MVQANPASTTTSVLIPGQIVPDGGNFHLDLHISGTVNISAENARRLVNREAHRHISYLLQARPPWLTIAGKQLYWRVPLVLTFPDFGSLGEAGHIDVDVESGEMIISATLAEEIRNRAAKIAESAPYQTTPAG
jgi:antitoxin component of MazEF toxin-antitoxin module